MCIGVLFQTQFKILPHQNKKKQSTNLEVQSWLTILDTLQSIVNTTKSVATNKHISMCLPYLQSTSCQPDITVMADWHYKTFSIHTTPP